MRVALSAISDIVKENIVLFTEKSILILSVLLSIP